MTLTPAQLRTLRELQEKATATPWRLDTDDDDAVGILGTVEPGDAGDIVCVPPDHDCEESRAKWPHTRAYIILLANSATALLDAAERAGRLEEFVRTLLRSEGWNDPSRDGMDYIGPMPSWVKPARTALERTP